MQNMVKSLSSKSAQGRISAELLRMASPMAGSSEHLYIRPSPRLVKMAQRLNISRETVSRTVNSMQKKGILKRDIGMLIIQQPKKLQAYSIDN